MTQIAQTGREPGADPVAEVRVDQSPDVVFLAPGDVSKGRVEPISWMQTCRAYSKQGADVTLVTLRVRRPDAIPTESVWAHYGVRPSFRIVVLPTPLRHDSSILWFQICAGLSAFSFGVPRLARALVSRRKLVVHARGPVLLLPFVLLRGLLPRGRRPVLILESHSLTSRKTGWIARRADLVVVTTSKLAADVQSIFRVKSTRVLHSPLGPYNAIRQHPKDAARKELDLPSSAVIAAYVGKLTDEITEFLLRAGALVGERVTDFQLMLVGGNPAVLARTRALAERLGIQRIVRLPGFVEPSRVEFYQAAADVLVFHIPGSIASFEYCTPSKGYEYQAAGRPIVATDIPLFEDVFGGEGERAIRVERTPHALADGVLQALALPDGGRAMTERAAAWVEGRTWENRTQAILQALRL